MRQAYAYKNSKEILLQSSSGGAYMGICYAFIELANNNKWSVYGACFDENFQVVHNRAITIDDCERFCGSKYVQSNLKESFSLIANDLREGYYVLFTGTPCQVDAVLKFLRNIECDTEKLYTVDIVCHGTPKPMFWMDYVKYLENRNKSKLIKFSFRYKKKGWKGYPILAEFENGKRYENAYEISFYMNLFRKNLLMRNSCFNCQYPGNFKSDITIGDFWGIELCMPKVSVKNGVSLILTNNSKGYILVQNMKSQKVVLEKVINEDYVKYNHNLLKSTSKPVEYEKFWNDYKDFGMEYVIHKYGDGNFMGKIRFIIKRFLRDTNLLGVIKKMLRRP